MAFKSKPFAALLSSVLGAFGAHHAYLGRRWMGFPLWVFFACASLALIATAVQHKDWHLHWAFFVFGIPLTAGFIEGLVIALMPDEKWDAKYNAAHLASGGAPSQNRWGAVLIAIGTLLVGVTTMMTILILMIQTVLELHVKPLG